MARFTHDCSACRPLGTSTLKGRAYDWYVCGSGPYASIIARWGSDGPEYWSAPRAVAEDADGSYGTKDSPIFQAARKYIARLGK